MGIRLSAEDAPFLTIARKRYAAFPGRGRPDLSIELEPVRKKLRAYRPDPRVAWDGRSWRRDRHDIDLDLAPGVGRAVVTRGASPLDSLLRIILSFELARRGGFLCHSAAVDGWLFPGMSGAGKSTLGRHAPKPRLLADELVGVVGTTLYGTPFRGDFQIGRNNIQRPLKATFFLDRHGPRGVRPVSKPLALASILRCALYFGNDVGGGSAVLAAARKVVERAPTFTLSYDARKTPFKGVEALIKDALR